MAGMILRKTGTALAAALKWTFLAAWKLTSGMVKLSLLIPVLAVCFVSSVSGVSSGRR